MTLLGQRDGSGTTIHLSAHKYTRQNYFCRKDHKQRVGPRMSSRAAGKTLSWGMLGDQRCLDKHVLNIDKIPTSLSHLVHLFINLSNRTSKPYQGCNSRFALSAMPKMSDSPVSFLIERSLGNAQDGTPQSFPDPGLEPLLFSSSAPAGPGSRHSHHGPGRDSQQSRALSRAGAFKPGTNGTAPLLHDGTASARGLWQCRLVTQRPTAQGQPAPHPSAAWTALISFVPWLPHPPIAATGERQSIVSPCG